MIAILGRGATFKVDFQLTIEYNVFKSGEPGGGFGGGRRMPGTGCREPGADCREPGAGSLVLEQGYGRGLRGHCFDSKGGGTKRVLKSFDARAVLFFWPGLDAKSGRPSEYYLVSHCTGNRRKGDYWPSVLIIFSGAFASSVLGYCCGSFSFGYSHFALCVDIFCCALYYFCCALYSFCQPSLIRFLQRFV